MPSVAFLELQTELLDDRKYDGIPGCARDVTLRAVTDDVSYTLTAWAEFMYFCKEDVDEMQEQARQDGSWTLSNLALEKYRGVQRTFCKALDNVAYSGYVDPSGKRLCHGLTNAPTAACVRRTSLIRWRDEPAAVVAASIQPCIQKMALHGLGSPISVLIPKGLLVGRESEVCSLLSCHFVLARKVQIFELPLLNGSGRAIIYSPDDVELRFHPIRKAMTIPFGSGYKVLFCSTGVDSIRYLNPSHMIYLEGVE